MFKNKFVLSLIIFFSVVIIGVIIFSLYNRSIVKDRSENKSDQSMEESVGNIDQPDEGSYDFPKTPEELNPELDVFKSLSEEQRLANLHEYELMRAKMPGNRYVPIVNNSKDNYKKIESRERDLKEFISLESKVYNNKATKNDMEKYYTLKIEDYKDKKEFLQYAIERNIELKKLKSEKSLSYNEIKSVEESIIKIDNDIISFTKKRESL